VENLFARWQLRDVFIIYFLRLAIGLLLVQFVFPAAWTASTVIIELADRLVVLLLIYGVIKRCGSSWRELGITRDHLFANILWGLLVGLVLLLVSLYSERMFTTMLLLTPSQHPLVTLVEASRSWQELLMPLFLAGVAAPVTEELLYRMVTFLPLTKRFGLIGGALGSAFIFALMHFNLFWLAEMMIVGVGLALLYFKTGSLVSAIVAHSFINSSKIFMIYFGFPLV
jgi:membrane protease YdiL (CAAX protease family)